MREPSTREQIARLVIELGRTLTSGLEGRLSALDLTFPQAMLLRHLGHTLPMCDAADRMRCDPSNITGIVDRLEARGLVERRTVASDRRIKALALTREGQRLKRRVDAILADAPGLAELTASDQAAMRALLKRSLARSAHAPRRRSSSSSGLLRQRSARTDH